MTTTKKSNKTGKPRKLEYRGDGLSPPPEKEQFAYLADEDLVAAVNMALVLRRPLLLKGPPGCGKTLLARAVAHELGLGFHPWYVKSTSKARDGLYTVDVLGRLQDAQAGVKGKTISDYIHLGPLGEAIKQAEDEGVESVVLIDEVDKADIDFPNDLLRELDEMKFTIEELPAGQSDSPETPTHRREYSAVHDGSRVRPLIFITSNDEKELPDAFLRRCLFHWIDFPDAERLKQIVEVNLPDLGLDEKLLSAAIGQLENVRRMKSLRKTPATSELVDWLQILHHEGVSGATVGRASVADLPASQALYKHHLDLDLARRTAKKLAEEAAQGEAGQSTEE